MFNKWKAYAGTRLLVGAPAKPMPTDREDKLRSIVHTFPQALFAYVPQIYMRGKIDPPAQVVYLVLRDEARPDLNQIMRSVVSLINVALPAGDFIDVLPVFTNDRLLPAVITSGCVLAINEPENGSGAIKIRDRPNHIIAPDPFSVFASGR